MWICLHIRCYWPTHSTICYKKDMQDIDQGLADWTIQKILKSQQKRRKANNRILSIVFSFWRFIHLVWSWNNSTQIYAATVSTECSNYVCANPKLPEFLCIFCIHATFQTCGTSLFYIKVHNKSWDEKVSYEAIVRLVRDGRNSLSCNCLSHLVSRSCLA